MESPEGTYTHPRRHSASRPAGIPSHGDIAGADNGILLIAPIRGARVDMAHFRHTIPAPNSLGMQKRTLRLDMGGRLIGYT